MRPTTVLVLLPALSLGCHGKTNTGDSTAESSVALPTPEQTVLTAADGDAVDLQGTVFTLTFDSVGVTDTANPDDASGQGFDRLPGRYLLIRSTVPDGVTGPLATDLQAAWGLGIPLPEGARQPQIGSVVHVTGTFTHQDWNGNSMPMVTNATVDVVSGEPLAQSGASCHLDADCDDDLICARATQTCTAPPAGNEWSGAWHGVVGACETDDDCPLGQTCDPGYAIQTSGDYAPNYYADRDGGKHLCVPTSGLTMADLCGTIRTPADLVGGRWVEGKELCIAGTVLLSANASDGDTHEQLTVDEPLPYPVADAPYGAFGATTENVPPYKDPSRPEGALVDPPSGASVVVLGTVHYDDGHGWFELHPVKAYWTTGP